MARGGLCRRGGMESGGTDTSEIKGFDETPATMLHLVVRKIAA